MPLLIHRDHNDRPWGFFDRFTQDELSTVKIITVSPNKRFSLQKHTHRSEFWRIISGVGTIIIGKHSHTAGPGDEFEIHVGIIHRMTAGEEGITFLEIALGDFDENDIVRLSDDFGRVTKK